MALLAILVCFSHLLNGFRNRQLVSLMAGLLGTPYGSRQATYDLRRLRRKALICRLEHSQRYQLTPLGRAVAVLFLKAHGRVLGPGFAFSMLPYRHIAARSPLALAWRRLDQTLNEFMDRQFLAA